MMKVTISAYRMPKQGTAVVTALSGSTLLPAAQALDKASGGAIARAMAASRFKGESGQWLDVLGPAKAGVERILVAGLGKARAVDARSYEKIAGEAVQKLSTGGAKTLAIVIDAVKGAKVGGADAAAHAAYGARLGGYRFDKYRTKVKDKDKPSLAAVTVVVDGAAAARRAFKPLASIAEGIFFTRDLVSEPPNVLYPESFAARCREMGKLGLKVEVLGEARMAKLGMGSLLGVGQGSRRQSQLVVMRWLGGRATTRPLAFVGKGVTFDTGGISLKPGPGMESMKWDMGGAGTVAGLMRALALRKAKVNAIGVIGLVENMPDGNAQRPGDIVTSMSGQTIEIHNTDAEGRLVLADALWYTQNRFKPEFMIDLATLTGAILVSLGNEYAGLFSNNDTLSKRLAAAGEAEGEGVWRMPLGEVYDKLINCAVADMKNVGGRNAGSITAAQFLQRFVNKVPWVHLDIAGKAWSDSGSATIPKGGTGYGVRLLNRMIADHYES